MKTLDVFGYSFGAIKLRKLRAALTTLGVVIGIAAIVALLSITQGLQATITTQLNQGLSADTLIVTLGSGGFLSGDTGISAGSDFGAGLGQGVGMSGYSLYISNASEISALSPDIEYAVPTIHRTGYIQTEHFSMPINIYGVDFNEYAQVYSSTFRVENGTLPTNPSENDVVVGTRVNQPGQNGTLLFQAGDKIELIWTNATTLPPMNKTYTADVRGVLGKIGGFGVGGPSDTGVYIPLETAESLFGTHQCDMIIVKLRNSDNATITNVSKAITDYFSNQVSVISSTAVLNLLSGIFGTIQLFLAGIAAIALLVAGIGIMNIMIVSLIERTREIGILKALGMKNRTVLTIFLGESIIIGLIGAVVGIVSGWALANVTATVLGEGGFIVGAAGAFTIIPLLNPMVVVGALGFGIGVSVVFALYPAWRASKLKPVEALRYE